MANFTLGPWKQEGWVVVADRKTRSRRALIADCSCATVIASQWEANAKLIAKAPALVSMLEFAAKYLAKAVADDLMTDCAISPAKALEKIERLLSEVRGEDVAA